MARWLRYLAERSPPAAMAVIAGGVALSGAWLGGGIFAWRAFVMAFAGVGLFLVLARLMDELKDYDKDRAAHPERPLPRGLISVAEAQRAVSAGAVALLAYAAVVAALAGPRAGALYAAAIGYLWLMYREFYVGAALQRRPVLYAITHQLVVMPLYAFAIAVGSSSLALSRLAVAYAVTNIGASMAYEVARKLDLQAHPALRTYGALFGPARAAALLGACCAVAAAGALALGGGAGILVALDVGVIVTLAVYLRDPRRHRAVEAVAGLVSLAHLWAVPLGRLWKHLL